MQLLIKKLNKKVNAFMNRSALLIHKQKRILYKHNVPG